MTFCFNRITLGGYLSREPELRQVGDEHRVAQFSLAVNASPRRDAGGNTLFIEVEAWDRQADMVMQYLHKGSPLLLDGTLQFNRWQDRDGNNRSKHLVRANQIRLIPRGRGLIRSPHRLRQLRITQELWAMRMKRQQRPSNLHPQLPDALQSSDKKVTDDIPNGDSLYLLRPLPSRNSDPSMPLLPDE